VKARDYQTIMLCGFIHNRKAFSMMSGDLNEDLITEPDLQAVYEAMLSGGNRFTLPEIASQVEGHGGLPLIRDIRTAYRRYGLDKDFSVRDVSKYVQAVEKLGRMHHVRTLLSTAVDTLDDKKQKNLLGLKDDEIVASVVNELVSTQYGSAVHKGFKSYDYFLDEFKVRLDLILSGKPSGDRLPTGFRSLDRELGGGLPSPGLTVIAGPPGSGKTQLAWTTILNIANRLVEKHKTGICAINSAEMTGQSLASRAVLSAAGVDSTLFRTGGYNDDAAVIRAIKRELRRQRGLPIFIDDSDLLTSNIISARVSGLRALYKDVVIVVTDFAEIISDKGENTEQRVSSVFVNAKALAKRLNCAVVLLSQVSRAVENSGTRVPSMRHLRYSGMAEAIADLVILIYNPSYYINSGIKLTPHPQMPPKDDIAYLIVGKHREGATGFLPMQWSATFAKWSSLRQAKMTAYQDGDD